MEHDRGVHLRAVSYTHLDVTGLEETLVHTLKEKGLTIATAESCTGGMIAQRLTRCV